VDIKQFMDMGLLQEIQDLFSDATGLAAIAVDMEGNYITKGSNFTDFCMKYTRGSEEGRRRCVKCDNECTGTYFCHAGLMDFSADIMIEDEKVGAIIGGQVLPNEPDLDYFRGIAHELGINETEYLKALAKVPVRSEKMIRSAAQMLGRVVNQLVNLEYIKKLNQKKVEAFDKESSNALAAVNEIRGKAAELQRVASMEKILAINASIEAARAGQAGVGFAIVAREISDVSNNSAKVYGEIVEQVKMIENSVKAMNDVKL
jgi:ligand-binding sensor protein